MPKFGRMTICPRFLKLAAAVIALVALPCMHASAIDPAQAGQVITPSAKATAQAEKATQTADAKNELRGPALLAIAAIIVLGGYFLIKRAKNNLGGRLAQTSKGAIEVCRTRTLGGKQYLVVVQVEGKRMLLGVGPSFITKLADLEPEDFSIPFERKDKPAAPKSEDAEAPNYPFNNLITRINESLSRKDDKGGSDKK
jgi:flagellar biogenesis protein FliO